MANAIKRVSYHQAVGPVETCDRCSAAIRHVYVVEYKDGISERYGSECINKILNGDTSLKSLFNKNVKLLKQYQRSLEILSMPIDQMPRGREYYGSGLYFIGGLEHKNNMRDVFGDGQWFFHPIYDAEKNAAVGRYVVKNPAERMAGDLADIEKGKVWFAGQIARIEAFLARIVAKGLATMPAGAK